MLHRTLILDSVEVQLDEPVIISSSDELNELTSNNLFLESPPDLTLDIRSLPVMYVNSLLKFIEEYKGNLTIIAEDKPINKAILSRFIEVIKVPNIKVASTDIRYVQVMNGSLFLTNVMKSKILDFLDLNQKATEELDTLFEEENGSVDYDDEYEDDY